MYSASRGNVGLMCLAFVLFNYGSAIPIVQQSILRWATHLSPTSRLKGNPKLWNFFVQILTYSTVAAVAAAVCILNLSLWDLRFTVGPDGEQRDVGMKFDNFPRPAAWLSFIVATCIVLFVCFASILHCVTNGWNPRFNAALRHFDHDARPDESLNSYSLVWLL